MQRQIPGVHADPEIMGGTPGFVGTRVPVRVLFDDLEENPPPAEFLDDFPSVQKAQAIAVLEHVREFVVHAVAAG